MADPLLLVKPLTAGIPAFLIFIFSVTLSELFGRELDDISKTFETCEDESDAVAAYRDLVAMGPKIHEKTRLLETAFGCCSLGALLGMAMDIWSLFHTPPGSKSYFFEVCFMLVCESCVKPTHPSIALGSQFAT